MEVFELMLKLGVVASSGPGLLFLHHLLICSATASGDDFVAIKTNEPQSPNKPAWQPDLRLPELICVLDNLETKF